jgi:hypothetical protein
MRSHGFLHTENVARPEHGLPQPGRAVLPYAAIVAAAPAFVAGHALGLRAGVAVAGSAIAAAAGAALWSMTARMQLRDRADRYIATGAGDPPAAAVLVERRAELVGGRERRMLAATLRRAVAAADRPPVRSARVPLDAAAVRAERAQIERLAALLSATDVSVSARAVARTSLLVTDATSPLYGRRGDELHRRLVQTLFDLEGAGVDVGGS